jgi:hypothetical protein
MVVVFMGTGGIGRVMPSDITIQDNQFTLTTLSSVMYNAGIQRLVMSGNTITNVL